MSAVSSTRNKLRRAYRIGLEPNRFQGMNSFFAHGLGNDCSHPFSGFDKVLIGKMGIVRRGPVPPMAEYLADQG